MVTHLVTTGARDGGRRRADRPSRSPYDIVTDRIIAALEAGTVPWRQPWRQNTALPCNAVSQRTYRGINLLLLSLLHYHDHRWVTYKQAQDLGGHVRAGEQSSIAVFWKQWERERTDPQTGEERRDRIPVLRFYHVFNVQQCDGLQLSELELTVTLEHERIEAADALVRAIPNPPRIHEGAKVACYYPQIDVVQVPPLKTFRFSDGYYATLFHELGHATGHVSRLNRPNVMANPKPGTSAYSHEELVAELTSAFLSAVLGLDNSLIDDAASYIAGWLKVLKADPKAIIIASGQAQRAADYLRGLTGEGDSETSEEDER